MCYPQKQIIEGLGLLRKQRLSWLNGNFQCFPYCHFYSFLWSYTFNVLPFDVLSHVWPSIKCISLAISVIFLFLFLPLIPNKCYLFLMIQFWNKSNNIKFLNHDNFDLKKNIWRKSTIPVRCCVSQIPQSNSEWFLLCSRINSYTIYKPPMQAQDVESSVSSHPFEASRALGVAIAEGPETLK